MILLTSKNTKLEKAKEYGWSSYGLHLSPYKQNMYDFNMCPMATNGCIKSCLNKAGMGGMDSVQKAREKRTNWYLSNREEFLSVLYKDLASIKEEKVSVRLNLTSDVVWEQIKYQGYNMMEHFPHIMFMDYTKIPIRFSKNLPRNYHLTFSRSENNDNDCLNLLRQGFNVAVVFEKLPNEWNGFEVINGDIHDLRFLDKKGVVVGLKYKNVIEKGFSNSINLKDNDFIVKRK